MLILTEKKKNELLEDMDMTLMKAALAENLYAAMKTLATAAESKQIWGIPLTLEQIAAFLSFTLNNYDDSVRAVHDEEMKARHDHIKAIWEEEDLQKE